MTFVIKNKDPYKFPESSVSFGTGAIPLNFCLPINSSKNNLKSEINDQSGYLKVAGLFFSITAWLNQAKP
ncbi:hypothetical protein CLA01_17410 [Chryseobacterium lathyri]|uniref:Uncharacterized protein n=1 Tax=Chryseobacterium lathyri TaxID=395933 RepID=A0A511Y903_9FLAO|nr:hypothetical protein CLA01_17410 [Chryseobacterium lathyri]